MSFDPYASGSKKHHRKKHFYQSSDYEDYDEFGEFQLQYEEPQGRRAARKQSQNKRKRQVSEFY